MTVIALDPVFVLADRTRTPGLAPPGGPGGGAMHLGHKALRTSCTSMSALSVSMVGSRFRLWNNGRAMRPSVETRKNNHCSNACDIITDFT